MLICQRKQKFDPPPFRVVRRKGTMTTASRKLMVSMFLIMSLTSRRLVPLWRNQIPHLKMMLMIRIYVPQNDVSDTQRYRDKIGDQLDDMDKMYTDSEADLVNNMNWILNSCIVYYFA